MISERFQNLFEDRGPNKGDAYSPTDPTPTNAILANATTNTAGKTEQPTLADDLTIEVQSPLKGFGSYLQNILPPDIAQGAGAFAYSMLQVKNIKNIPIEKFAQVVTNIETTSGLTINGTNVPTNTTLAGQGLPLIAKGSGPYGTYTMSDFYGCMSGLPYIGLDIDGLIKKLETSKLYSIYEELYLATTWKAAVVTVQSSSYVVESPPTVFTTYYHVTGVTISNSGGGYGRADAPPPIITISGGSGATATCTIGTDPSNAGTNGAGTFGRLLQVTLTSSGTDVTTPPSITIETPPTATYAYPYTGGTNTVGGSFSNTAVQDLINDANAEILNIGLTNNSVAAKLNTNWSFSGRKLSIEQEAITIGSQVHIPSLAPDEPITNLAQYPTTQISFTDLVPIYGLQTQPHMQAQTLEAIADLGTIGGQSIVGLMREARNQNRLTEVGISLDNNINDTLTLTQNKQLIANGTLDGTQPAVLGQVVSAFDATGNVIANANVYTNPYGTYDTNNNNYYVTNPTYNGTQLGTVVDTGAAVLQTSGPGVGAGVGTGVGTSSGVIGFPGSLAGSNYGNLLPSNLNALYTSNNLLPSSYTVNEAIEEVIRCNCDCWNLA